MHPSVRAVMLALVIGVTCGISAFSTTSEFNTTVGTVTQLVQVNADLNYPQLLPGSEYAKNVTVHWALPAESLSGLTSDRVVIHVVAYSDEQSWMVFYGSVGNDGQAYRAYAFDLDCHVQNGACAQESHLSRTILAVLRVPANGTSNHSERLLVQASLMDNYRSVPIDNNSPGFFQGFQNVLQNLPIAPLTQLFQQYGLTPSATGIPSTQPNALRANDSVIALEANVTAPTQVRQSGGFGPSVIARSSVSGRPTTESNTPAGFLAQTNPQTGSVSDSGAGNTFSPFAGLSIAKSDAVLYGGLVVFALLAFLFYRHFFDQKDGKGGKANGVFEA